MNNIKDFHKELLSLLKKLDTICTQKDIKYSLFAGTLIGAIRHKGFIPWDDDADVVFERREYDKFIEVLPADFTILRNSWVTRFVHKDNLTVYLDVFVFDTTSNSKFFQKLQVLGLKLVQGTLKNKIIKNRGVVGLILSFLTYLAGLPFSKNFKLRIYNKLAQTYKHKEGAYIFSSLDQFKYIGHMLPKSILNLYHKVDFEDTQLMILDGYDFYLKKFYGDYMKVPPIENQIPEHGNV